MKPMWKIESRNKIILHRILLRYKETTLPDEPQWLIRDGEVNGKMILLEDVALYNLKWTLNK